MEKKRKHPNFIDIILIVLVVAVAAVAYFLSHQDASPAQTVKRSYVLEVTQLDPAIADCVEAGDTVTDNIKNYDMGVVTAVERQTSTAAVLNKELGEYVLAEYPDKVTLYITIEADTTESDSTIATESGYTLRIGTGVSCTIGAMKASGYIVGLDR